MSEEHDYSSLWIDGYGEATQLTILVVMFMAAWTLIATVAISVWLIPSAEEELFNKCIETKAEPALCVNLVNRTEGSQK